MSTLEKSEKYDVCTIEKSEKSEITDPIQQRVDAYERVSARVDMRFVDFSRLTWVDPESAGMLVWDASAPSGGTEVVEVGEVVFVFSDVDNAYEHVLTTIEAAAASGTPIPDRVRALLSERALERGDRKGTPWLGPKNRRSTTRRLTRSVGDSLSPTIPETYSNAPVESDSRT